MAAFCLGLEIAATVLGSWPRFNKVTADTGSTVHTQMFCAKCHKKQYSSLP